MSLIIDHGGDLDVQYTFCSKRHEILVKNRKSKSFHLLLLKRVGTKLGVRDTLDLK